MSSKLFRIKELLNANILDNRIQQLCELQLQSLMRMKEYFRIGTVCSIF